MLWNMQVPLLISLLVLMCVLDLMSFGWQKSPVIKQREMQTIPGEEPPNAPVYSEVWYSGKQIYGKGSGAPGGQPIKQSAIYLHRKEGWGPSCIV